MRIRILSLALALLGPAFMLPSYSVAGDVLAVPEVFQASSDVLYTIDQPAQCASCHSQSMSAQAVAKYLGVTSPVVVKFVGIRERHKQSCVNCHKKTTGAQAVASHRMSRLI